MLKLPQPVINLGKLLHTKRATSLNLSLASAFVIVLTLSYGVHNAQILLPPPLRKVQFTQKQTHDVSYRSPMNDVCWAIEIPCAFEPKTIQLRDSTRGLQAGFIRAD